MISSFISPKLFIDFMKVKHEGQVDKVGQPYYLHPAAVSDNVQFILSDNYNYLSLPQDIQDHILNHAIIVAVCHDLYEDTDTTPEDLIKLGADDYILTALKLLTHNKSDSYGEYVEKISGNGIAMLVKLADLTHNMDIKRFSGVRSLDEWDLKRLNKYLKYYDMLQKSFNNWLKDYNVFVS